ncbi:DUF1090 domain-containing protein [Pseudomonas putida]|uniref:DUF1090 domain-containing protein n=1 Tax=Pseudomonas putida TaxID=303 RepID=A0A1Q9R136_PSEPU|nr:DUF1090 domain-containing protein [Pseudomonas putida]OLS61104.1 hypothetical protein PSEMO_40830 [Pseudomonas putida]
MKSISPLALFALCAVMAAPVMAIEDQPGLTGCAAKQQSITAQIEQARLHGNAEQQAGLERALSEVQAHCTDAGLRKEREQKVLDARHEVAQRKKDLDKAMKKGDAEKINKRKDKLAEANRELQAAVEELEK